MGGGLRKAFLGISRVLAAAGSGPAAQAMFEPGRTGAAGPKPPPAVLASLADGWVFMLDETACPFCPEEAGSARCAHGGMPTLRCFQCKKDSVRWLLGKAPAAKETRQGPWGAPGAGMRVAVDAAGQVLVADPVLRLAYQIDPGSLDKKVVAGKGTWPTADFRPVEVLCAGGRLIVAGKPDGHAETLSLGFLIPRSTGGLHEFQARNGPGDRRPAGVRPCHRRRERR
jgi:hypothetical protein